MKELLQNILYIVITTILPILITYIVKYLKTKRDEKLVNIDNEYLKNTIRQATDTVMNVVDTVSQTYVDDLKKAGTFTPDNQSTALNKAIEQAKTLMNDEVSDFISDKYNDLDEWIRNQIEAYIKHTKAIKDNSSSN